MRNGQNKTDAWRNNNQHSNNHIRTEESNPMTRVFSPTDRT